MDRISDVIAPKPAQGPSTSIVVLGGGLAGLYAAYHLANHGIPVIVVEKEFEAGGILRAHRLQDYRFSLAEAPLVTEDRDLADDLAQLLPPEWVAAISPPPPTLLRWNGSDLPLPLRLRDLLPGLPPAIRSNLVFSQLGSSFRPGRKLPHTPTDAAEAIRQRFGTPLFEMVLQSDLEHYWSLPLKDLAPAVAQFPMRAIFSGAPADGDPTDAWIVQAGPEVIAARLTQAIQRLGGRVFLGAEVDEIVMDEANEDAGSHVIIRDLLTPAEEPPSRIAINARAILSTIPLRSLVRALGSSVPAQIHASSYYLSHLPVQAYACVVRKDRCLDHPTVHFRDRPFLRITEPGRFAPSFPPTAPSAETLIVVEVPGRAPQHSSEGWQHIVDALESECICTRDQIAETQFLHAATGHPILRKDGAVPLERIRECLARFQTLAIAGACGRFACVPPATAMTSARDAAALLLQRVSGQA